MPSPGFLTTMEFRERSVGGLHGAILGFSVDHLISQSVWCSMIDGSFDLLWFNPLFLQELMPPLIYRGEHTVQSGGFRLGFSSLALLGPLSWHHWAILCHIGGAGQWCNHPLMSLLQFVAWPSGTVMSAVTRLFPGEPSLDFLCTQRSFPCTGELTSGSRGNLASYNRWSRFLCISLSFLIYEVDEASLSRWSIYLF
jgi:hypothetical protein